MVTAEQIKADAAKQTAKEQLRLAGQMTLKSMPSAYQNQQMESAGQEIMAWARGNQLRDKWLAKIKQDSPERMMQMAEAYFGWKQGKGKAGTWENYLSEGNEDYPLDLERKQRK